MNPIIEKVVHIFSKPQETVTPRAYRVRSPHVPYLEKQVRTKLNNQVIEGLAHGHPSWPGILVLTDHGNEYIPENFTLEIVD